MSCREDRSTPFWDTSLSEDERLDWLLENMTLDEKLHCLSSGGADIERLGIPGHNLGGEAAHGVEARNDQNGIGKADPSTSFPQPIGMSATWDRELIEKAGRVTGKEARVIAHRHGGRGLSRWAPTVDLERDPRWGRNEEDYGEDPYLTGEMASAYVKGMQGKDPYYICCASTLKHFYGNNTENGRGWKNSSIDPRNRNELYLQPFEKVIREGKAAGVMTAYNKINGIPGILNPEVREILKDKFGLLHAVGDGGAMALVSNIHHYYGLHGETIASALKAGVDGMSDQPAQVYKAAKEAYELGLVNESDLDRALRSTYRVKLRLGLYDRTTKNPYDSYTEADLCSEENSKVSLDVAKEAVVLLRNDDDILPLTAEKEEDIALAGPLGNVWYQDWYGGEPPYRTTLLQGLNAVSGHEVPFAEGYDRVVFRTDGGALEIGEDGAVKLGEEPDEFYLMDWGSGNITFRSVRTGRFLTSRLYDTAANPEKMGEIRADALAPFDWFVMEIFHIDRQDDGTVILKDRFQRPVTVRSDGSVFLAGPGEAPSKLEMETVSDGTAEAVELAGKHKTLILALGSCPMVGAKEEIDRTTIALPPHQQKLLDEVCRVNENVILVFLTNFPYSFTEDGTIASGKPVKDLSRKIRRAKGILWSASGSQDMGTAVAETIFGKSSPAGRTNETWYQSDSQLPDINDYDIIKGKRTCRYFDGDVIWPFGFGLTYSKFSYSGLKLTLISPAEILAEFEVTNIGNRRSDEVAELYACPPATRVPRPLKQLVGFVRLKAMEPGETKKVTMTVPLSELSFYDTISGSMMTEEGEYLFFAGSSSEDRAAEAGIHVPGERPGLRDTTARIRADHYDEYENIELTEGAFGYTAASLRDDSREGSLIYRDAAIAADAAEGHILLKSEKGCHITFDIGGKEVVAFDGDTGSYVANAMFRENSLKEGDPAPEHWPANWMDISFDLPKLSEEERKRTTITIHIRGNVKILYFRFSKKDNSGRWF